MVLAGLVLQGWATGDMPSAVEQSDSYISTLGESFLVGIEEARFKRRKGGGVNGIGKERRADRIGNVVRSCQ